MKKVSLFASLVALAMGMASMIRAHQQNPSLSPTETVAQDVDAAFRDGLFLGKLAAARGDKPHIATGRWATFEDRSSFIAGYQRGYSQLLVSRVAPDTRGRAE